jgi:hypothetical protein
MKKLKLFSKQLASGTSQSHGKQYANTAQADLSFIIKVRLIAAFWLVCAILACGVAFI